MKTGTIHCGMLWVGLAFWMAAAAGVEGARARRDDAAAGGDRQAEFEANRLLEKAQEYLRVGENERGFLMLQSIVDRWPAQPIRFQVWLIMGRHSMDANKWADAIPYFTRLLELKKPDQEPAGDELEWYLESLYLTGVCYYQISQYDAAFPALRKITTQYPNTVWANQAYYYIGMCHFAKENWNRAIDALSMVGTFMDFDSLTAVYAEAGRRIYLKVTDNDLPVVKRLGRDVVARISTSSGDDEKVNMIPLTSKADIFIGSIASEVGIPVRGDNRISVLIGDRITASYVDENTKAGERNVPRTNVVKVVSSGGLQFTLATSDEKALSAYQGRSLTIQLTDADLDTSPAAETVPIRLVVRYPKPKKGHDEEVAAAVTNITLTAEEKQPREEDLFDIRDEVMITLKEVGANAAVRTGVFRGSMMIVPAERKDAGDRSDAVLSCAVDDEILALYVDACHIGGMVPREVRSVIKVTGEIDTSPSTRQHFVSDPDLRARKALVESQALLELGKIFKNLGLLDGARKKCLEGIALTDDIIREQTAIKPLYKEEAFKTKWELYLTMGDLDGAMATCQFFSRLFPNSRFVNEALIRIGDVYVETKKYPAGIKIYEGILQLANSTAKAEAQFKIAEAMEKMTLDQLQKAKAPADGKSQEQQALSAAMPVYRRCAELFPDSEFAGPSLAKVVDFYVMTGDFAQGEDLLEKVFQEYPDSKFLDRMLLKWVLVAFKRGDYAKAHEKCQQLLFEYPGSQYADTARKLIPQVRKALNIETPDEPAGSAGGARK